MKRFLFVFTLWFHLFNQLLFSQQLDSSKVAAQIDSIIKLVRLEIDNENWNEAIAQISLAENLSLTNFGSQSAMIGICYFNRGRILYFKGDYTEAETWYQTSIRIIGNSIGKENAHYAACLNNLANLYLDIEDYNKAESIHLEVKALREKLFGKNHPEYAASLNNLAILYMDLGAFEKSELYYLEVKEIQEKKLGKNTPDYVKSVINLANLYSEMRLYEKSKLLFTEAYDISIRIYGKNDLAYSGCLTGMSNLYKKMGNFEEAEHLLIEAKSIRETLLGKEHSNYTTCVINLANLYVIMGKYEKAEPLYLEAIDIDAKILGKEHPYYAIDLSNLASLYKEIGFFNKAEALYLEAKDIREKAYGKESLYYAESLDHLGILYRYFGNFEKAEPLSIQAKLIFEKVLGKEDPQFAWSVNNLAALYYSMKNYEKAEKLFLEALPIFEKVFGKKHSDYGVMLSNLADLYTTLNQFSKAEPFFLEASKIFEYSLGKAHAYYTENLNHLAVLYEHTKKFDKAELLLSEISILDQTRLLKASTYLSERELGDYITSYQINGQVYCDYLSSISDSDQYFKKSTLPGLIYNHSLFYKGFLLNSINSLKSSIFASSKANEISDQLKSYRRQLSEEYAKPLNERKNVLELEQKENSTEKELARSLVGYFDATKLIQWQDVQLKLKQTEAALEFVFYKVTFPKSADSLMYAALLIRPGDKQPKYVTLFEEKSLDSLLNSKLERKADYVNSLYTLADRGAIALEASKKSLYEILWKPLEKELAEVKTIYFSPSGLLHRINLDAIPINETETLADRYKLIEVNSTRQLVVPTQIKNANNDAVLYGGIQYEQDSMFQNNEPLMVSRSRGELSFKNVDTTLRGGNWNYLAGTDREVSVIEKIMQTNGVQTKLKKGYAATEESLKNIVTNSNNLSPRILHISTHGYFFSDPKGKTSITNLMGEQESVFKISEHPMLRSGLIMAGGNATWQGKSTPVGREDGILTAYEISQMNLSNTELVVLSACETGLGDIQGNEGVYGLQRAFKIAGAKYLIMSLWQVPDKQTSLLMITFYKKWLEDKMSIPDAFHAAQKELRDVGLDPYQWAGFVLVE